MDESTYVVLCGMSPHAIINSVWASIKLKNLNLNRLVLVTSAEYAQFEKLKASLESLLTELGQAKNYKIDRVEIFEENIEENILILNRFLNDIIANSTRVIFDITPGRKTMSLSLVIYLTRMLKNDELSKKIRHVHYNFLKNADLNESKWFPEIHPEDFTVLDLIDELR